MNQPQTHLSRETAMQRVLDEAAIRDVVNRYCRGIDRRQFDMVRSCYHPDATDDHGGFKGGVEAFIAMCTENLKRYERTMHFMGNLHIEVDGDQATSEAYTIAFHRLSAKGDKPARDHVVGFRYVDNFERRLGEWKIARRVCVFEWTRTDPVPPGWDFTPEFMRGQTDGSDWVLHTKQK
jgi:ketosteroid isomerase-like protein